MEGTLELVSIGVRNRRCDAVADNAREWRPVMCQAGVSMKNGID
jgi:hypothetical protein